MGDGFVEGVHDFHCEDEVEEFGAVILGLGGDDERGGDRRLPSLPGGGGGGWRQAGCLLSAQAGSLCSGGCGSHACGSHG